MVGPILYICLLINNNKIIHYIISAQHYNISIYRTIKPISQPAFLPFTKNEKKKQI